MLEVQPKDSRGYFILPQAPEEAGYYVYGTPPDGRGQYAHPSMLSFIFFIEREWAAIDNRKFGIGNISLAGGVAYAKHKTHKSGLEVDVRPLRKDGSQRQVYWYQEEYDRDGTAKLIALFQAYPGVRQILFNDKEIPFVKAFKDHDHHFHVAL